MATRKSHKLKVAWKIENCMLQYEKSFQLQPGSLPLDPTDGAMPPYLHYAPRISMALANTWGFVRIEPHGGSRNGKGKMGDL